MACKTVRSGLASWALALAASLWLLSHSAHAASSCELVVVALGNDTTLDSSQYNDRQRVGPGTRLSCSGDAVEFLLGDDLLAALAGSDSGACTGEPRWACRVEALLHAGCAWVA